MWGSGGIAPPFLALELEVSFMPQTTGERAPGTHWIEQKKKKTQNCFIFRLWLCVVSSVVTSFGETFCPKDGSSRFLQNVYPHTRPHSVTATDSNGSSELCSISLETPGCDQHMYKEHKSTHDTTKGAADPMGHRTSGIQEIGRTNIL
jgi:hypothetical protein